MGRFGAFSGTTSLDTKAVPPEELPLATTAEAVECSPILTSELLPPPATHISLIAWESYRVAENEVIPLDAFIAERERMKERG